jgi:uncharacterized protein DUF6174
MTRSLFIALAPIVMTACADSSGPPSITYIHSISAHRAQWRAQSLPDYSYTYQFWAFNRFAGQALRLEVRADTVRSVVVVATGEIVSPAYFPTIEALFDRALDAAIHGSLRGVAFDSVRGFPTHLGYATVPDGLSSQDASDLQPP